MNEDIARVGAYGNICDELHEIRVTLRELNQDVDRAVREVYIWVAGAVGGLAVLLTTGYFIIEAPETKAIQDTAQLLAVLQRTQITHERYAEARDREMDERRTDFLVMINAAMDRVNKVNGRSEERMSRHEDRYLHNKSLQNGNDH